MDKRIYDGIDDGANPEKIMVKVGNNISRNMAVITDILDQDFYMFVDDGQNTLLFIRSPASWCQQSCFWHISKAVLAIRPHALGEKIKCLGLDISKSSCWAKEQISKQWNKPWKKTVFSIIMLKTLLELAYYDHDIKYVYMYALQCSTQRNRHCHK